MSQADQAATILGKKLIAHEIKWSGHVTAAIDVGVKGPLVVDEESVYPIFLADQAKFLDRSRPHFLYPRDDPSCRSALLLHAGLIPEKKISADEQPQEVEAEKEKREVDG